ncbi:hypothetical protein L6452_41072 [Arctium lappa]|uniref:Uncharacterized protein n=1 Tax=Arctium lappa TaxID=4217 RepID=A0ACB8XNX6_ARCLA|nr:hypothetical protein L6452_41072 [Arctium lappa]
MKKLPANSWNSADKARNDAIMMLMKKKVLETVICRIPMSMRERWTLGISRTRSAEIQTVDEVVDPDGGWNEEVVGGNSAEGGDLYGLKDGAGGGRFGEKKVSDAYGGGGYRLEEKPLDA